MMCAVQWAKNPGVRCALLLGADHEGVDHTNFRVVWPDEECLPGSGNEPVR